MQPDRRQQRQLASLAVSPAQCRAARAAVTWSQSELVDAAAVSRPTVQDFERGTRIPHPNNLTALRHALEGRGVRFVDPDHGLDGVLFPCEEE